MILMAGEVLVFLCSEAVLLLLLVVAAVQAVRVLRGWDFLSTSRAQYGHEKRAALVGLIVAAVVVFKLLLLPFFTHTVDRLSALVPGAMCGAGVLGANAWGTPLLLLKVFVLFTAGIWWLLRREDGAAPDHPYMRRLLLLALGFGLLVLVESVMDLLFLTGISTLSPVQCCSRIFGVAGDAAGLPLGLNTTTLLVLFYLLYLLALSAGLLGYRLVQLLAGLGLLLAGYYAVVYFFGTYVYQLPTHLCPVCMLQPAYGYIGYWIWGTLLAGTFFALAGSVLQRLTGRAPRFVGRWAVLFQSLFVVTCSLTVGIYYLRNGVLLQ